MTHFPCGGPRLDAAALALRNAEAGHAGWPPVDSLECLEPQNAQVYRMRAREVLSAYYDYGME